MKLEKRDVYIKEFWTMIWLDRYVYTVVNTYCRIESREKNPLKWSIEELVMIIGTFLIFTIIPFTSIFSAFYLKHIPMPESNDPMFKGGQDWREVNKWVVKR